MDNYSKEAIKEINRILNYADFKRMVSIDCFNLVTEHEERIISVDVNGEVKEVGKL